MIISPCFPSKTVSDGDGCCIWARLDQMIAKELKSIFWSNYCVFPLEKKNSKNKVSSDVLQMLRMFLCTMHMDPYRKGIWHRWRVEILRILLQIKKENATILCWIVWAVLNRNSSGRWKALRAFVNTEHKWSGIKHSNKINCNRTWKTSIQMENPFRIW